MLTAAHEALENNGKIAEGLLMNCLWSVQFRSRRIIHIWIQLRTRTSRKKKMKRYVMGFFEKSRTKMRFSLPLNCNNHLWKLEDGNTLTSRVGREQRGHDSIIAGFFYYSHFSLLWRVFVSSCWLLCAVILLRSSTSKLLNGHFICMICHRHYSLLSALLWCLFKKRASSSWIVLHDSSEDKRFSGHSLRNHKFMKC